VFARISTFSTCGETANSSVARAPCLRDLASQVGIAARFICKLSKMPNLAGPILNHTISGPFFIKREWLS